MKEAPVTLTYARIVRRESIQLGLLIAALNIMEDFADNIQNAYLTSPCQEKMDKSWARAWQLQWHEESCCTSIVWSEVRRHSLL